MREVTVVEGRDREHPYHIERQGDEERDRAPADPEHAQAAQVQHDEGQHPKPVDALLLVRLDLLAEAAVDPAQDREERAGRKAPTRAHREARSPLSGVFIK